MFELPRESGRLKLDLFCHGARVGENCRFEEDARPVKRTRGGLGSGLDAILPGNVWVNIPVEEPFAKTSPYWIDRAGDRYVLWRNAENVCELTLPPHPDWYDNTTSSGKRIGDIGVMQGTYFAVYPSDLCGFWKTEPKQNCRFCSIGLCHGKTESEEKSVSDVVEAVQAARKHERITFVHFNTGFYEGDAALDVILPYVEAVKKETGLLVGVQCPPALDLSKYDRLKAAGADHVSFCFELFDPERFAEVCPGKAEAFGKAAKELAGDPLFENVRECSRKHLGNAEPHPGQLLFYLALLHCVNLWGKGPVAGEIIAGLEPTERSMQAVDFLADCGAVATVCVFRPCIGTDLENESPPDPEALTPVFARQWEAVASRGIPVGIAPNIRTAMVHLQEESRCLSRNRSALLYRMRCAAMKPVFRTICALKRKA